MDVFFLDVRIISRGDGRSSVGAASYRSGGKLTAGGRSAVAASAYRSGEALVSTREGQTFDYTRKDGILHTAIMAPDHAPTWVYDRAELWNRVEAAETRKDAQLTREVLVLFPRALPEQRYVPLLREFIENFTQQGMVADVAIHRAAASDGQANDHAHCMLTMRRLTPEGFDTHKARDWNSKALLEAWRQSWEEIVNRHLEEAGSSERISRLSYAEQGINKEPTRPLGYRAHALEMQGIETDMGNYNRAVRHRNALREAIGSRADGAAWETDEPAADGLPLDDAAVAPGSALDGAVWAAYRDAMQETGALVNRLASFGLTSAIRGGRDFFQRVTSSGDWAAEAEQRERERREHEQWQAQFHHDR